jgi:hypothetical protein
VKDTLKFESIMRKMLLILTLVAIIAMVANGFQLRPLTMSRGISNLHMMSDLDTGDFEGVKRFSKVSDVSGKISKYLLEATIDKKELNSYLEEYKEEMKRRKVVFPGFRAGKLPPYVMADVRKYLVCYGLETILGSLCNNNGLKVGRDAPMK